MFAILVRLRCGVPVILCGECGCGKTMLIKYLCAWLDAPLLVLDVHGGTSASDIVEVLDRAQQIASGGQDCFLFLDELNTCVEGPLPKRCLLERTP